MARNNNNGQDAQATDATAQPASGEDSAKAKEPVLNAAAGAPRAMRQAAERLPERDAVQKAYKQQLTAEDTQTEVDAKVTIVDESPDAADTPSGAALKAVQGESDPLKQAEQYARRKAAVRNGSAEDAQ